MSNVNPFDKLRIDAEQSRSIKCQRSLVYSQRGQSLFEVVFALAVAAIVMIGVVSLAATSVRNSTFARNQALATRNVQEASEWLRQQRDIDWVSFNQKAETSATWCLRELNWSGSTTQTACGANDYVGSSIFIREINFTCYQANATPPPTFDPTPIACSSPTVVNIEAEIRVSWTDAQGIHQSATQARYTKWQTP